MRGEPHADVAHQGRAARRALLDEVEHVVAVQHREVGVVAELVDEPGEDRPGQALQRRLPRVGGTQLEGGDAEPIAPLLRVVGDVAVLLRDRQQVVGRRAGEVEVSADRGGGQWLGVVRQEPQHLKRSRGGAGVGHSRWAGPVRGATPRDPAMVMTIRTDR